MPEVQILSRANAFGYQDHNLVTITQRLTDHLPVSMRKGTRELLWKVRAKRVILATGAHERPIVFGNNDLPGVMLASAVSTYIHRYGVLPGRKAVVFTNNDDGYQCALDLKAAGAKVTVVDPRAGQSTARCRRRTAPWREDHERRGRDGGAGQTAREFGRSGRVYGRQGRRETG